MLTKYLTPAGGSLLVAAPDDDAAVWRGLAPLEVATIDTLVEDVDFRLSWPGFDFLSLGRRLLSVNLSDLAAMGATPRHALVSVCLHSFLPATSVTRLYDGISRQARRYGCTVAGGDISGTTGPLMLTAALFGTIPPGARPLLRRGARPGWGIAVTGRLGDAALGLQLLEAGKRPVSRSERRWVKALLEPQPRLEAAQLLRRAGVRVAGDISDGVFREVEKMAGAAGLGALLEGAAFPSETRDWRLIGSSEDFELICAAPVSTLEAAGRLLKKEIGLPLTIVGRLTSGSGLRLDLDGREMDIAGLGYEHFS